MLPLHATIATTSPRRKAMILALRPDIRFIEMRGNIDTRLRKWSEGQADALVLAAPGSTASAAPNPCTSASPSTSSPPLPARARSRSRPAIPPTRTTATSASCRHPRPQRPRERVRHASRTHVLAALGGGCQLPLGAYCHQVDAHWHLHAQVAAPDGEQVAHIIERAPVGITAEAFGQRAAAALEASRRISLC